MAATEAKRAKTEANRDVLLGIGRRHHVSKSGIEHVLKVVRHEGLPEHSSRSSIYRARKQFFKEPTPYGQLIEHLVLDGVDVPVLAPAAILHKYASECEGFGGVLATAADSAESRDEPCSMILYGDGVSPQDGLSMHDERKFYAIYWSLQEFGQRALATEQCWFTLFTLRNTELEQIGGGIARVVADALDLVAFNAAGVDLSSSGVILPLRARGGKSFLLKATVRVTVADAPALKDLTGWKGHNGLRCCLRCRNVILRRHFKAWRDAADNITHDCPDLTKRKEFTDTHLREGLATLEQLKVDLTSKGDYETCESRFGFAPSQLAVRPWIKVIESIMFDWMHCYVANGCADGEFGELMASLHAEKAPVTYATVAKFLLKFVWPKNQAISVDRLFNPKSAANYIKSGSFNSSASEMLSLIPPLGLYFATVGERSGHCLPAVQSFVAVSDCVELIQCVKEGIVAPQELRKAVQTHLTLRAAIPREDGDHDSHVKPHYTGHFPDLLEEHGDLYSCWTHERRHNLHTKYAKDRKNTQSYELGILEDTTIEQYQALQVDWLACGLLEPVAPRTNTARAINELFGASAAGCACSRKLRVTRGIVTTGDVVFFRYPANELHVGELLLALKLQECPPQAIVTKWARLPVAEPLPHVWRFRAENLPFLILAESIERAAIYSLEGSTALVLVPPPYR